VQSFDEEMYASDSSAFTGSVGGADDSRSEVEGESLRWSLVLRRCRKAIEQVLAHIALSKQPAPNCSKVLRRGCALDPSSFLDRFGFERVLTRGQASLSNTAFPVSSFCFVSPVHPK
jgi:hypothetical protein